MENVIQETVSLTQAIKFDGVTAVRLTGTIYSDETSTNSYSVAVANTEVYLDNLEACRAEIDKFKDLFTSRENDIIADYNLATPPTETTP